MRVITLVLSPRYQLFSEATPRKIVGTEGTIKCYYPHTQSISVYYYISLEYN
jgi:hypothetical protein